MHIKNKKVLVVGLGISGVAAAELLARHGADVWVTESGSMSELDRRKEYLAQISINVQTGGHTEEFMRNIDLVVMSPGVDHTAFIRGNPICRDVPVVGELELGYLFCPAPIVAVTGTNGKSTTAELIGNMLKKSGIKSVVCGNIGNPLCGEVSEMDSRSVAVVEVSSFQLETIKEFRPHIAILLNVTEDHYERHGNYEGYKFSKFRIFMNQTSSDWALLNSDMIKDPMLAGIRSRKMFFTRNIVVRRNDIAIGDIMIPGDSVPIKGDHNSDNIACAVMAARIMGATDPGIAEGVRSFRALDHRFEKVSEIAGIEFIDDSKATNIDATKRALESLSKKVVLIAGGRDKGGDYRSILPMIREKVRAIVLIGEARERISTAFSGEVPLLESPDMSVAVKLAYSAAKKGDAVLLSPMCSSFDMFSSYKDRGNAFQSEVRRLSEEMLIRNPDTG